VKTCMSIRTTHHPAAGQVPATMARLGAVKAGSVLSLPDNLESDCVIRHRTLKPLLSPAAGPVPASMARLGAVKGGSGTLGLSNNLLNGDFPTWLLANETAANATLNIALQACTLVAREQLMRGRAA